MKKKLFLIVLLYVIISIFVGLLVNDYKHFILGWNVILAYIPYIISIYLLKIKQKKIFFLFCFTIWLLFLPNSFYIITDFIHIQNYEYYTSITNYNYNIIIWVALIHIAFGFIIGSILGMLSLININKIIKSKIVIFIICLLSSIGIYIGRFLRFNSWDIIKPITLIKTIINNCNLFTIEFIILITISIYAMYLLLSLLRGMENE